MRQEERAGIILDAIGGLPDEMIREADCDQLREQEKKTVRLSLAAVPFRWKAVAVLILFLAGGIFGRMLSDMVLLNDDHPTRGSGQNTIQTADAKKTGQKTEKKDENTAKKKAFTLDGLTVIAYAREKEVRIQEGADADRRDVAENEKGSDTSENQKKKKKDTQSAWNGYQEITLEEGKVVSLAEYAPWMSSVPAMPFSFYYDAKDPDCVSIEIETDENGILQEYTVNEEGEWNGEGYGSKMSCASGDTVYWKPQSDKQSVLSIKVYDGGKEVCTCQIVIFCKDGMKYQVQLLKEEK